MAPAVTVIGSPVSPYVRKVLACCAIKGVEVKVDPISPFLGDDGFSKISPLRRIPVWIEAAFTLCDSSAIVQYIEETRAGPSLWPADPKARAQARWLEEYGVIPQTYILTLPASRVDSLRFSRERVS